MHLIMEETAQLGGWGIDRSMKRILAALLLLCLLVPACALADVALYEVDADGQKDDSATNLLDNDAAPLDDGRHYLLTGTGSGPITLNVKGIATLWLKDVRITSNDDEPAIKINNGSLLPPNLRVNIVGENRLAVENGAALAAKDCDVQIVAGDDSGLEIVSLYYTEPISAEDCHITANLGSAALCKNDEQEPWQIYKGDELSELWGRYARIEKGVWGTLRYPDGSKAEMLLPVDTAFDPMEVFGYLAHDQMPEGQMFDGWVQDESGKFFSSLFHETGALAKASEGTTFTARMVDAVEILWLAQDESGQMTEYERRLSHPRYFSEAPEGENLPGLLFKHWKLSDADAALEPDEPFYSDRDMTFIAQYEPAQTVKLTFRYYYDREGNKTEAVLHVKKGSEFLMNLPVRCGFNDYDPDNKVFAHWKGSDKSYRLGEPFKADADAVFEAVYESNSDEKSKLVWFELPNGTKTAYRYGRFDQPYVFRMGDEWDDMDYLMIKSATICGRTYAFGHRIWLSESELAGNSENNPIKIIWNRWGKIRRMPVPGGLPETGDASMLGAWMCLLGASAAAMGLRRKK